MNYRIYYSRRKTLSLSVNYNGETVVKASPRHPKRVIDQFVAKHIDWIENRKRTMEIQKAKQKKFATGELFLYLGNEYPLRVISEYRSRLAFDNAFFLSIHKQSQAKHLMEQWYKSQAKIVISERVKYYAELMDMGFRKISIKNMHTRWGSCSSLGNLNFSWRLVLAPLEIVDYVVVHELVHLVHKNHSKKFWDLVRQFYPGWKQARGWLNKNGESLIV